MTTTENLKKHIADLEEKRLSAFFHMQHVVAEINGRLYNFSIIIAICSLAVTLSSVFIDNRDVFLIAWSSALALAAMIISFVYHLYILDKNSNTLFKSIRKIYGSYDNEYVVLKKFDTGEINENLIRQYYIEKTKKLDRYAYNISLPGWPVWIALSLMNTSIILLILS